MTFGCKVNQYETAALAQLFSAKGFIQCNDPADADICVVNTCSVTAESDSKAVRAVRKLRRLLPDGIIAVTGCMTQAHGDIIPEADIITGTADRKDLPELVAGFMNDRTRRVRADALTGAENFEELTCSAAAGHTRAFLKIQDGCERFCAYCIIPYTRGRMRSRAPESIAENAAAFAANGHSEIVLTGINLASYGREYGLDIADAVRLCAETAGIERVRLSSLEPDMITERLIEKLAEIPQLCPSFHISLQSGCAKTLSAMGRRYSPDDYYDLTLALRRYFPDCSLATDVMTGFPGETEDDHRESLDLVKKVGFASMHVFPYSVRPGTRAADMPGQVPQEVKYRRAAEMTAAGAEMRRAFLGGLVGKRVSVLFERERGDGFHRGHAPDYTFVKVPADPCDGDLRGRMADVAVTAAEDGYCAGELIR